jgi:hypothetical protein
MAVRNRLESCPQSLESALRPTVAKTAHRLDLIRECVQQPRTRRRHAGDMPVPTVSTASPAQHRHGDCVRAGHLYRKRRLDFVLRLGRLDEGQSGIHAPISETPPHGSREAFWI